MGGSAFWGGFSSGLSNTLQQAQQRQTEQEYKKALIEQSKLQTKMLENKLNLAQYEQQVSNALIQSQGGITLPSPPAIQNIQVTPQQRPQSILGRLFNPQPPQPQPTEQPTQPPIQNVIAQGQMEQQLGQQTPEQKAWLQDYINKKYFDMPPWKQKFMAESKQVGRVITTIGPNGQPVSVMVDKTGKPMEGGSYQQPIEYTYHNTQPQPGGPTISVPVPKYGAPPALIAQQPKGETPEAAGKIQAIVGGLQDGLKFLQTIKDPQTGVIDQKTIAGMTAPFMGSIGGIGSNAREGLSLFRNAVDAIVRQRTGAQIRADEWPYYNSIYLPDYKDSPALQQSKIERLNRDLAGALMQTDPNQVKLERSLSVKGGLGPSPQLPSQAMTPVQAEQELIKRGYKRNAQGQWVR